MRENGSAASGGRLAAAGRSTELKLARWRTVDIQEIYRRAQAQADWLTGVRRALHRIPEEGFREFKTQALICRLLDEMGIPYRTERTWVIGEIAGAAPGAVVALRADMDALPLDEPEGLPFRSEHAGWMHACGHDAHMAVQLGAARLLASMRDAFSGTVRLLFQPAEETVGGAAPMVAAGAMRGVAAVYGLHVQPYMNVGRIDSRPGCLNASTDEVNLAIRGVAGHAARPEQCVDAIVCAAQMVSALQTVVSRGVSPLVPAVLTFGKIAGGTARNVVCDRVELSGTLRTADPAVRAAMKARIREVAQGVAAAFGARVDVDIVEGYCALMNDPGEVERAFRLGRALLGAENVAPRESPSMGGEDFSYFCAEAPGACYHLGCAAEQPAAPLHSRDFRLDERCLPIGCAMQCALALDRLSEAVG